jgi:hypothetical protein
MIPIGVESDTREEICAYGGSDKIDTPLTREESMHPAGDEET